MNKILNSFASKSCGKPGNVGCEITDDNELDIILNRYLPVNDDDYLLVTNDYIAQECLVLGKLVFFLKEPAV